MTILVCDDEDDIRNLLKIALENQGHAVITAGDGRQALELLDTEAVDLAILDVMMPVLDGFNLLLKIRARSTLPVIMLTARAEDADKVLGLGLGADDYLAKPFSLDELLARVAAQLRRNSTYRAPAQRPADRITYGELAVDRARCAVTRAGVPVELGAKEYKLLLFFMENPERVFTKGQLYRAVWGDDYLFDDNTVMVHMSRLRSRIEADPQTPRYLKTIRGIGYKLHDTGGVS